MIKSDVRIELSKALFNSIEGVIEEVAPKIERTIFNIIWDRNREGYDIHGRKWRRYKAKNYMKIKGKYGRGADDWLQLTGSLKNNMKVKYIKTHKGHSKIEMQFDIIIGAADEKKVEGLISNTGYDRKRKPYPKSAYEFLGMSEKTSPNYVREVTKISKILGEGIKKISSSIKTK